MKREAQLLGFQKKKSLNEMLAEPLAEIRAVAFAHMRLLTIHSVEKLGLPSHYDEKKKTTRDNLNAAFHNHMLELDAEITVVLGNLMQECENKLEKSAPFGPFAASRKMFLDFLLKTISTPHPTSVGSETIPP